MPGYLYKYTNYIRKKTGSYAQKPLTMHYTL